MSHWVGASIPEGERGERPGVLQRGLTMAQPPAEPLRLPSGRGALLEALPLPGTAAAPLEADSLAASDGILDLTGLRAPGAAAGERFAPAADGTPPPAIPAAFMLAHMPLAEGLPQLPNTSPRQQASPPAAGPAPSGASSAAAPAAAADGGHAALLWLESSGGACSPGDVAAAPSEHAVELGFAADLAEVRAVGLAG